MNLTFSRKLSCFLTCAHRESESAGDRTMVLTSPVPRPADSSAFSLLMVAQAAANASLLSYVFPTPSELSKFLADARVHWVPYTKGCELANDCYCFHVAGDMSHKHNPEGWKRCAKKFDIETCQDDHSCSCLRGEIFKRAIYTYDERMHLPRRSRMWRHVPTTAPFALSVSCLYVPIICIHYPGDECLFSDMRPVKILSAIAAARAAGIVQAAEHTDRECPSCRSRPSCSRPSCSIPTCSTPTCK